MPGTTISATPIFVSKPSPTRDAAQHEPARAAVSKARTANHSAGDAAQDEQLVGVVVARDRHHDRRGREREAGDEPGEAAEAPAHEVVGQADRDDAHQRLRDEQAERVEAEHARRQRLDPES